MFFLTFNKCCCCIDLRVGCLILGYLSLVYTIGIIVEDSLLVAGGGMQAFQKYDTISFLLLQLAFVIALLVGLHKNKPDYLKAFMMFCAIFLIFYTISFILSSAIGGPGITARFIIERTITILLGIYFLLVINSMYFRMKDPSRGPAISVA